MIHAVEFAVMLVFGLVGAKAQSAASWSTIAAGAGTLSGNEYSINATLGQSFGEGLVGTQFSLTAGFWAIESTQSSTTNGNGSPLITQSPASLDVLVADTASFSVVATGSAPLSYQWFKDSVGLAGATNSTLVIQNAQVANAGDYFVIVSNAVNTATSQVAVLTVSLPPPPPGSDPQIGIVRNGNQVGVQLTSTAFSGPIEILTTTNLLTSLENWDVLWTTNITSLQTLLYSDTRPTIGSRFYCWRAPAEKFLRDPRITISKYGTNIQLQVISTTFSGQLDVISSTNLNTPLDTWEVLTTLVLNQGETITLLNSQPLSVARFYALQNVVSASQENYEEIVDDPFETASDFLVYANGVPDPITNSGSYRIQAILRTFDLQALAVSGLLEVGLVGDDRQPAASAVVQPGMLAVNSGVVDQYVNVTLPPGNTKSYHFAFGGSLAPVRASFLSTLLRRILNVPIVFPGFRQPGEYTATSNSFLNPLGPNSTPLVNGTFGEWPGHSDVHGGIDLNAPLGTSIYAVERGVVTRAVEGSVTLYHGNGLVSWYCHVSPLGGLRENNVVNRGDIIGRTSVSGGLTTTGQVHLHFEIRKTNLVSYTQILSKSLPKSIAVNPVGPLAGVTFTPEMQAGDANPPVLKAVGIVAVNPVTNLCALKTNDYQTALTTNPQPRSLLFQTVDPRGPRVLMLNSAQVTQSSAPTVTNSIILTGDYPSVEQLKQKPGIPGYALLSNNERTNSATTGLRYKLWTPLSSPVVSNHSAVVDLSLVLTDSANKVTNEALRYGMLVTAVVPDGTDNGNPVYRADLQWFNGGSARKELQQQGKLYARINGGRFSASRNPSYWINLSNRIESTLLTTYGTNLSLYWEATESGGNSACGTGGNPDQVEVFSDFFPQSVVQLPATDNQLFLSANQSAVFQGQDLQIVLTHQSSGNQETINATNVLAWFVDPLNTDTTTNYVNMIAGPSQITGDGSWTDTGTPFIFSSGPNGAANLKGIVPGEYIVRVVHSNYGIACVRVDILPTPLAPLKLQINHSLLDETPLLVRYGGIAYPLGPIVGTNIAPTVDTITNGGVVIPVFTNGGNIYNVVTLPVQCGQSSNLQLIHDRSDVVTVDLIQGAAIFQNLDCTLPPGACNFDGLVRGRFGAFTNLINKSRYWFDTVTPTPTNLNIKVWPCY